jgi:hypothetical protein
MKGFFSIGTPIRSWTNGTTRSRRSSAAGIIESLVIVEERDYHVYTGKLTSSSACTRPRGSRSQSASGPAGRHAFTTDVGRPSTVHAHLGIRRLRRPARRPAGAPGGRAWVAFLGKIQPLIHTQENRILIPPRFSPLCVSVSEGQVALVTGGAQGIGAAIRRRARGRERDGRRRRPEPPEAGIRRMSRRGRRRRMVDETLERHGRSTS